MIPESEPVGTPGSSPDPKNSDSVPQVPADVATVFGERAQQAIQYAELLAKHGVERGLIGPREVPILWSRHIYNSAAVAQVLPTTGTLADVGSGAGLPGIVLAILAPGLAIDLVEPMERRTTWLEEVVAELGLTNVEVVRARAEELHGKRRYDVVTARAVAAMDKLVRWCLPLVKPGGELVALKGQRANEELVAAQPLLKRKRAASWSVSEHRVTPNSDPTYLVRVRTEAARK